nr:MAG TPA: hypothetical protein [Caudoviricetes sp.]
MEREFKFEVGQYVKITEEELKRRTFLPNYPCKITYQFFNGDFNIYVIDIGDNKEETILEGDLRLYANNSNDYGTIHGMQEEILALQRRMTILEVEVSKANREYKAFSSPISKVKGGGGSNPYKVEADVIK